VVGIIGIVLFVGVFVFGLIAAIAVPAYFDYMERAARVGM
jgi:Tfp pilus assembly protein PilE